MNYFNIYLEGLALMYIRRKQNIVSNEGLLYPVDETSFQIMPGMSLEDTVPILNSH